MQGIGKINKARPQAFRLHLNMHEKKAQVFGGRHPGKTYYMNLVHTDWEKKVTQPL